MSIERLLERLLQERAGGSVTPGYPGYPCDPATCNTLEPTKASDSSVSVTPVTPGYTCDSVTRNPPEDAETLGSSGSVTPVTPVTPEKCKSEKKSKSAKPDLENILEDFEERAAILEYDAGMPRPEAGAEAYRRAVVKYRLNEYYGNPPMQGGGTAIGIPGETAEDVWNGLRERYGVRLCEPEPPSDETEVTWCNVHLPFESRNGIDAR